MANQRVGNVYEIGLNEVGYMLADNPQRPVRRQVGVLDAQPPGSDDPLSERIGRYDFVGASDWTGGEGQVLLDRPSSDPSRYWYSEGLDPFTTPGQITCLPVLPQQVSDTYATPELVSASNDLYVRTDNAQLTEISSLGATTAFNHGLAGTPTDRGFASDGQFWYITDGATIRRNSSAADPAADWSTEDVTEIAWCTDRLMGIDNVPATAELISFDSTGTGTVVVTLANRNFQGLCGGDGYVWFGVGPNVRGHINYWQVDSSPTNTGVALVLPEGEYPSYLFFYLGNVFLSTTEGGGYVTRIYRCVPSDGLLTPQLITDVVDVSGLVRFAGIGSKVAFTWAAMEDNGTSGIGVVDLETGGYARWHHGGSTGASLWVAPWLRDFAISQTGQGVFGRDSADLDATTYRSGYFETSTSDLATPALKYLDEIQVSTLPLPSGTSVAVAYSLDGGTTFTTMATFNTVGATQHSVEVPFSSAIAASFRLKVTLTASGSSKPTVTAVLAKTHVTGITDEIVELPINCEDYIADVHGTPIAADSGPGKGMERFRALRALVGTKVNFQDVDWKQTGDTELVEVVGVESTSLLVYDQNRALSDVTSHVAIVQLRRPFSA